MRTAESAKIVYHLLQSENDIKYSKNLRERFFGDHELHNHERYQTTWDEDQLDSSHTINNVESTDWVMARITFLVASLEQSFKGETFLFVSHGDALQILQAASNKSSASDHRSLSHLNTASASNKL